ncbi:hypothetical protein [Nonomuraea sp. KM90]|uniref:hypothetical protein n=1 Tax=Nonomuraea sp. KM90 TaxID=3457428 RepID=UPI003FCE38F5
MAAVTLTCLVAAASLVGNHRLSFRQASNHQPVRRQGFRMTAATLPLAASSKDAVCCAPIARQPLSEGEAAELVVLLKAVADPVRLRLLWMIGSHAGGEACVCDRGRRSIPGQRDSHSSRVIPNPASTSSIRSRSEPNLHRQQVRHQLRRQIRGRRTRAGDHLGRHQILARQIEQQHRRVMLHRPIQQELLQLLHRLPAGAVVHSRYLACARWFERAWVRMAV